jgi:rhodanese-related sulfurtransferase
MKNVIRSAFLVLLALALGVGLLWYSHRKVTPKEATWEEVEAEAQSGGYRLITTEELAARYAKDPQSLLLVDTRQDWEYRTGHIQGAVNFPMEPTWWSRWRARGALAALLGPDKERCVVFY